MNLYDVFAIGRNITDNTIVQAHNPREAAEIMRADPVWGACFQGELRVLQYDVPDGPGRLRLAVEYPAVEIESVHD